MTNPLDTNDDWAELARELERDKPPAPPVSSPADMVERTVEAEELEPHHGTDARVEDAAVAEGETESEAADDDFDDAEEAESPAGEAGAEGEQPGTGRKRRRRRRRRRKGAAPADGATALVEEREPEPTTDADEEPAGEPVAEAEEYGAFDEDESDALPLAAEEDTASEVLRELIATWNVPSWDEIVSGLYRPN
jgi:ribonuclease E